MGAVPVLHGHRGAAVSPGLTMLALAALAALSFYGSRAILRRRRRDIDWADEREAANRRWAEIITNTTRDTPCQK